MFFLNFFKILNLSFPWQCPFQESITIIIINIIDFFCYNIIIILFVLSVLGKLIPFHITIDLGNWVTSGSFIARSSVIDLFGIIISIEFLNVMFYFILIMVIVINLIFIIMYYYLLNNMSKNLYIIKFVLYLYLFFCFYLFNMLYVDLNDFQLNVFFAANWKKIKSFYLDVQDRLQTKTIRLIYWDNFYNSKIIRIIRIMGIIVMFLKAISMSGIHYITDKDFFERLLKILPFTLEQLNVFCLFLMGIFFFYFQ